MDVHLLLVDDDALMRRSLTFGLERAGYLVHAAATAEDALQLLRRARVDLIILDINLPGMNGLDALKYLKGQANIPVIFLTARRRELDEILGLELGGDDYITKPVSLDVLLAHIKTVLRRGAPAPPPASLPAAIVVGDITLDPASHTVSVTGRPIELTPKEFDLLHTFLLNPNRVMSNQALLSAVWGAEYSGQPQVLYVHIRWLRKKIEPDPENPRRIVTIHGVGYKLAAQES